MLHILYVYIYYTQECAEFGFVKKLTIIIISLTFWFAKIEYSEFNGLAQMKVTATLISWYRFLYEDFNIHGVFEITYGCYVFCNRCVYRDE